MGPLSVLALAFTHPSELRALVSYKVWRDPLNDIKSNPEKSGWDRQNMRDCWTLLDLTSRSFAVVTKELKGELSRVICIFYLALRALDTIEDDMTIPADKKVPLLLDFYKKLHQKGWNFTESGPDEKDRHLLVDYHKVIDEFQLLDKGYQVVIEDITAKMGAGMASYIEASAKTPLTVNTMADWDVYCHFVAGLVGEGLSRIFAETGFEREWIADQLELSNHMGLFLQKVNIIRDYAEDSAELRCFWPKEAWGAQGFATQPDIARGIVETSPGSKHYRAEGEEGQRAMNVLSTLLLDAMRHATRSLDYLSLIREQSIFNFCAIPQVMAISSIYLLVNNPDVFRRNVKIRKSEAVKLILGAVNPRDLAYTFADYARKIHKKIPINDVNFTAWSVELARIESWCEEFYPSYVSLDGSASAISTAADVRIEGMKRYAKARYSLAVDEANARGVDLFSKEARIATAQAGQAQLDPRRRYMTQEQIDEADKQEKSEMMRMFMTVMGVMTLFMFVVALVGWYVAWWFTSDDPNPLNQLLLRGWRATSASVTSLGRQVAQDPVGWGKQKVTEFRKIAEL